MLQELYRHYKNSASMIRVKLRDAIESHRQRTGERITFERLAEMTGLSRQTVESLSSRQGYNTTLGTIDKLCHVLKCHPSDLLIYESEHSDGPPN